MGPSAKEIEEALRGLRATPSHLKRAASGLTDEQLSRPAQKDAWSLVQVLAHIRGAANVQGGWIETMIAEQNATIRYASPRTGMRKVDQAGQGFQTSLQEFTRQRTSLVKTLTALSPLDWTRGATFTGTTPGWTRTVFDVAKGLATHEQSHFSQIEEASRF